MKPSQSPTRITGQINSTTSKARHKLNGPSGFVNGVAKRKTSDASTHVNGRPSKKRGGIPWMDVTDGEVSTPGKPNGDHTTSPGKHAHKHFRHGQNIGRTSSKISSLQEQRQLLPIAKGMSVSIQ
jgi:hypothetical protein